MLRSILKRICFVALVLALSASLESCSNMRWGASAGVDVRFGPGGPRLVPNVELDMYSGGRF